MDRPAFLPRKRRKTGRNFSPKNNTRLVATSMSSYQNRPATRSMTRVGWKSGALPVELFEHIISYLPRRDIQNMRFVNHEFEEKVSKHLFKTVVVPFKPEIYDIADNVSYSFTTKKHMETPSLPDKNDAVILRDKGMRVFQGFGRHISRFAMSCEFDPVTLTAPPLKCDQEAITSFWGIFRWPHKTYNRYAQLEGLEQTADETRTLAQALTYITNATELALSVDSGLGWLSGPDVNPKMDVSEHSRTVFGESRFVPESKKPSKQKSTLQPSKHLKSDITILPDLDIQQQQVYERMLGDAGYTESNIKQAVILLADHDGALRPLHKVVSPKNKEKHPPPSPTSTQSSNWTWTLENDSALPTVSSEKASRVKMEIADPMLKPVDLTTAQKEMLLETEWAHRAFMQSYAIAVIDNPETFINVRTLTFARIPSRHIRIISRNDFWDSLPHLVNVSVAVIPDWREVTKLATTYVQDVQVKPSCAISDVHLLIEDCIAPRKSIKSFHFEWLCGGEDAPGMFARGQLILAAPVLEGPMEMVNLVNQPSLLEFPHIEHLSFKNCWFSPHILIQLVTTHRNAALRSLSLNSISLSAPSTLARHHPQPLANHAVPNGGIAHIPAVLLAAQNPLQAAGAANAQPQGPQTPMLIAGAPINNHVVAPAGNDNGVQTPNAPVFAAAQLPVQAPVAIPDERHGFWLDYLDTPRRHSWADVIDNITPGENLVEARFAYDNRNPEPPKRQTANLHKITFRSCGYVRVGIDLDHSAFDLPHARPPNEHSNVTKKRAELDSFMLKRIDYTLGTIIPWMDAAEMATLQQAFFLGLGWDVSEANYETFCANYRADVAGQVVPGSGRFYGLLQGNISDNSNSCKITRR